MLFLAALLVDGALAGAVYAPIALAFVVVYKASRMINFALGEWMMVGTRLVASGLHAGFGLLGAVGAACAGMAALAVVFNRVVLRHLAGRPGLTWIMVGILSVVSGTLWAITVGGGFGVVLIGLKVFPIVIVGGLDSILGTLLGAIFIGVLESVTTGYVDPLLGAGFGSMVSYLVVIAVLFVRPYGLLGKPQIERV